jgi:hypothetical protein
VPRYYKKRKKSVVRGFCTGVCEDKKWEREAENFPLLETVPREQLVKTQQAAKNT